MNNKLKKLLDYFYQKDFDCKIDTETDILFFSKSENDTKKCVQLDCKIKKECIQLGPNITEYIEVDKVEKILEQVTNKKTYFHYTISGTVDVERGGNLSENIFIIKNENELEAYVQLLDSYYNNYTLPFFKAIPTLQSFNDKVLSVVSFDDYPNYLRGEIGLKAMIIMKLCNNSLYEKYIKYREEGFRNSPNLQNVESKFHQIVKKSFIEFNKLKEMFNRENSLYINPSL